MPITPAGHAVPTKNPDHIAVIKQINVMRSSADAVEELGEDGRKWEAEIKLAKGSGDIRNAKVVSAISSKETMLGMLPAAIRREEGIAAAALAKGNDHVPALQDAGFKVLDTIESELSETIGASLLIYVSDDENFPDIVSYVSARTPFGRRMMELRTDRTYPPCRSVGELNQQATWFARVMDLLADWEQRKKEAGNPPVAA